MSWKDGKSINKKPVHLKSRIEDTPEILEENERRLERFEIEARDQESARYLEEGLQHEADEERREAEERRAKKRRKSRQT